MDIPTERLVAEALSKSGLLWISSEAGQAPVWHATVDGVAYVISGAGEQFSPEHSGRCEVVTRSKESRARLISFAAEAEQITPEAPDWEAATSALKAGRLNAANEDVVARWAQHGTVTRIQPDLNTVVLRGELLSAPRHDEADPQPAPATDPADPHSALGKVTE